MIELVWVLVSIAIGTIIGVGIVGYLMRVRNLRDQGINVDEDLQRVGATAKLKFDSVKERLHPLSQEDERFKHFYWLNKYNESETEQKKEVIVMEENKTEEKADEPELYVAPSKPVVAKQPRGQWMKLYHQYLTAQGVPTLKEFIDKKKAGQI